MTDKCLDCEGERDDWDCEVSGCECLTDVCPGCAPGDHVSDEPDECEDDYLCSDCMGTGIGYPVDYACGVCGGDGMARMSRDDYEPDYEPWDDYEPDYNAECNWECPY